MVKLLVYGAVICLSVPALASEYKRGDSVLGACGTSYFRATLAEVYEPARNFRLQFDNRQIDRSCGGDFNYRAAETKFVPYEPVRSVEAEGNSGNHTYSIGDRVNGPATCGDGVYEPGTISDLTANGLVQIKQDAATGEGCEGGYNRVEALSPIAD